MYIYQDGIYRSILWRRYKTYKKKKKTKLQTIKKSIYISFSQKTFRKLIKLWSVVEAAIQNLHFSINSYSGSDEYLTPFTDLNVNSLPTTIRKQSKTIYRLLIKNIRTPVVMRYTHTGTWAWLNLTILPMFLIMKLYLRRRNSDKFFTDSFEDEVKDKGKKNSICGIINFKTPSNEI